MCAMSMSRAQTRKGKRPDQHNLEVELNLNHNLNPSRDHNAQCTIANSQQASYLKIL